MPINPQDRREGDRGLLDIPDGVTRDVIVGGLKGVKHGSKAVAFGAFWIGIIALGLLVLLIICSGPLTKILKATEGENRGVVWGVLLATVIVAVVCIAIATARPSHQPTTRLHGTRAVEASEPSSSRRHADALNQLTFIADDLEGAAWRAPQPAPSLASNSSGLYWDLDHMRHSMQHAVAQGSRTDDWLYANFTPEEIQCLDLKRMRWLWELVGQGRWDATVQGPPLLLEPPYFGSPIDRVGGNDCE